MNMTIFNVYLHLVAPQETCLSLSCLFIMQVNLQLQQQSSQCLCSVLVAVSRIKISCFIKKKYSCFIVNGNGAFVSIKQESKPSWQLSQGLLIKKWQQILVRKSSQWHQHAHCLHCLWYFYDIGSFLLGSPKVRSYLVLFWIPPPGTHGLLIQILGLSSTLETHNIWFA